jgi:hypothetical protein
MLVAAGYDPNTKWLPEVQLMSNISFGLHQ